MDKPMLFIGLGGTGSESISYVRRHITESMSKKVVIDTDVDLGTLSTVSNTQKSISSLIRTIRNNEHMSKESMEANETRCHQLYFYQNSYSYDEVKVPVLCLDNTESLRDTTKFNPRTFGELLDCFVNLINESGQICIISAISGGTGSGMICDVAYYIQSYLNSMNNNVTLQCCDCRDYYQIILREMYKRMCKVLIRDHIIRHPVDGCSSGSPLSDYLEKCFAKLNNYTETFNKRIEKIRVRKMFNEYVELTKTNAAYKRYFMGGIETVENSLSSQRDKFNLEFPGHHGSELQILSIDTRIRNFYAQNSVYNKSYKKDASIFKQSKNLTGITKIIKSEREKLFIRLCRSRAVNQFEWLNLLEIYNRWLKDYLGVDYRFIACKLQTNPDPDWRMIENWNRIRRLKLSNQENKFIVPLWNFFILLVRHISDGDVLDPNIRKIILFNRWNNKGVLYGEI